MRVFIDTNVLIDVALEREAFVDDSQAVLDWCSLNGLDTFVAWHTITNCYYVLSSAPPRGLGGELARSFLDDLLSWASIAPADTRIARKGLGIAEGDFEDNLQGLCAAEAGADVIVTRNVKDFKNSPVRALTPTEFLTEIKVPTPQ